MLELLISILLAFGFSFDYQGRLVDSSTSTKEQAYQQVRSDSRYQELGGDVVLDVIIVGDNVDPNN